MPPELHAVLGASSAKRWLNCPPSARLEEKLKGIFGDGRSPYAEEGTKAHALAELKLYHELGRVNDFNFTAQRKQMGELPADMERATDEYVDIVLSKYYAARQACGDAGIYIEQRLSFSRWVPHGFGTGDCVIVSDAMLEVLDYKHGAGVKVDAADNPQARLYGLGALDLFGKLYDFTEVRNTIVQPRVREDPVTEETLSRADLLAWGEGIKETAHDAWLGKGEYKPGEWCRFCAAKAICAARAAESMTLFTHGFQAPGVIADEDIPGILKVADTAEAWIKDIRAYARRQALKGQRWDGFKLVRGRKGNRTWKDEEQVQEQLTRAGYGAEQYMSHKLKGPAEIQELLGKPAFDALVKQYVTQSEGALNLVPDTAKGAEVSSADADFSDLEEA